MDSIVSFLSHLSLIVVQVALGMVAGPGGEAMLPRWLLDNAEKAEKAINRLAAKDGKLHRQITDRAKKLASLLEAHTAANGEEVANPWGAIFRCIVLIAFVWLLDTVLLSQVSRYLLASSFVPLALRGLATFILPAILIVLEVLLAWWRAELAATAQRTSNPQRFKQRLATVLSIVIGLAVPLAAFATWAVTIGFHVGFRWLLLPIVACISIVCHFLLLYLCEHLHDAPELVWLDFLLRSAHHAHVRIVSQGAEPRRALNAAQKEAKRRSGEIDEPEWGKREAMYLREVREHDPALGIPSEGELRVLTSGGIDEARGEGKETPRQGVEGQARQPAIERARDRAERLAALFGRGPQANSSEGRDPAPASDGTARRKRRRLMHRPVHKLSARALRKRRDGATSR